MNYAIVPSCLDDSWVCPDWATCAAWAACAIAAAEKDNEDVGWSPVAIDAATIPKGGGSNDGRCNEVGNGGGWGWFEAVGCDDVGGGWVGVVPLCGECWWIEGWWDNEWRSGRSGWDNCAWECDGVGGGGNTRKSVCWVSLCLLKSTLR